MVLNRESIETHFSSLLAGLEKQRQITERLTEIAARPIPAKPTQVDSIRVWNEYAVAIMEPDEVPRLKTKRAEIAQEIRLATAELVRVLPERVWFRHTHKGTAFGIAAPGLNRKDKDPHILVQPWTALMPAL